MITITYKNKLHNILEFQMLLKAIILNVSKRLACNAVKNNFDYFNDNILINKLKINFVKQITAG